MGAGDMGEYVVPVGKFAGQKLNQIPGTQLHNYCLYVARNARENKKVLNGPMLELMVIAHAFLGLTFSQPQGGNHVAKVR